MAIRTCVAPDGRFVYGVHRPAFEVENLRENDTIRTLGVGPDGVRVDNRTNFPAGTVEAPHASVIFEIPNPFPFRGVTYINRAWADPMAAHPERIALPDPPPVSFSSSVRKWFDDPEDARRHMNRIFKTLPEPVCLALATTSTDPEDLVQLAKRVCSFVYEKGSRHPVGLAYHPDEAGRLMPDIRDQTLFEAIANNHYLPDAYKEVMVLRPGVQGGSEIVGDWRNLDETSHVYEYLRRNSYIPWGHYAANMAEDAVRYGADSLTASDIEGLRHLYYQRTYVRLARLTGLPVEVSRRRLTVGELEDLRRSVLDLLSMKSKRSALVFDRTLWGWNLGFDYAPSRYRLHASHQQVHQQFALIPRSIPAAGASDAGDVSLSAYACGDLIADFIAGYRAETGIGFFDAYIRAIENNRRTDGDSTREQSLVVHADENVMLFVPKAQTSQWELQLMATGPVGNILEADPHVRASIDRGILMAVRVLGAMGAKMITAIEFSRPFDAAETDQRLLYSFLPRLPESPGAFSEAQLRWINGHYPEDFAITCRNRLLEMSV